MPFRSKSGTKGGLTVHVVSHTHWDREWYHTASVFRQRLVDVVDGVIDALQKDRTLQFLLDGQAAILDDYLAVRPERRETLARLLRDGRLEAGPWYVLADELIPTGEVMVRNLLAGRRVLSSLGAKPPAVLYCPDSFGHPASLPTLASGFGFGVIILWRGFGGSSHPTSNCCLWSAPDGSSAILYHLARAGYELGSELPVDSRVAARRWATIRAALTERDRVGIVLLPNGADHHSLQRNHVAAFDALTKVAEPAVVVRSSLSRFAKDLLKRGRSLQVPRVEGELRDSYGYTWTLQGTFASRGNMKREFAIASRALIREADAWPAVARAHGAVSRLHHARAAWNQLLLAAPHDTICGCSIDDVAAEATMRIKDAARQGASLARSSMELIAGHSPSAARDNSYNADSDVVLVNNAAARQRGGVAAISLVQKVADIPVGPESARKGVRKVVPAGVRSLVLSGAPKGESAFTQELGASERIDLRESPNHYPDADQVIDREVLAWVPPVPGYSVRVFRPRAGRGENRPAKSELAWARGSTIGNGRVSAGIDEHGKLWLSHGKNDGRAHLAFEDQDDLGDLYAPSLRGKSERVETASESRVIQRGPLRVTLVANVYFSTKVDNPVDSENVIIRGRRSRPRPERSASADGTVALGVSISVDAGSDLIRLVIRGDNSRQNHRLRLLISGNFSNANVVAAAPFSLEKGTRQRSGKNAQNRESVSTNHPADGAITILGVTGSASLLTDSVAEYELVKSRTVAVTMLRCVGELSRINLPERPGNAGWPAATPMAQQPGSFRREIGWIPHDSSDWNEVAPRLAAAADDFFHPLAGFTVRSAHIGESLNTKVELLGEGLAALAIKESEDGRGVVLRCMNLTDRRVSGAWSLAAPVRKAFLARLDEKTTGSLAITKNGRIPFVAEANAIVTVIARPG